MTQAYLQYVESQCTYKKATEDSVIFQKLGKSSSCGEACRNKTKPSHCYEILALLQIFSSLSEVDLNQPCFGDFQKQNWCLFFSLFLETACWAIYTDKVC